VIAVINSFVRLTSTQAGEKPPAMLQLGRRLCESSFGVHNGGALTFRIRSTSPIASGF
jgi:hypothetical protein